MVSENFENEKSLNSINIDNQNTVIECESLTKIYRGINSKINNVVLKSIDLKIQRHSLTGIFGPSGSGKTTLLSVLGGFTPFDGGKVIVNSILLNDLKKKQRLNFWRDNIGFIYQNPELNLFMDLTVEENLQLILDRNKYEKCDVKTAIKDVLEVVGLKNFENRIINRLSGGETQRVAITTILLNKNPILIADEPTGVLDSTNSHNIFRVLKELTKKKIITGIVVSHSQEFLNYCDSAYILSNGLIKKLV